MVHRKSVTKVSSFQSPSSECGMCHPSLMQKEVQSHQDLDSDDSLKWEDFFGTSVDITSALLDMYDSLVGKNKVNQEASDISPTSRETQCVSASCDDSVNQTTIGRRVWSGSSITTSADNNDATASGQLSLCSSVPTPSRNVYSKRGFSLSLDSNGHFKEKKRPLSTSSVSSSSSSSSSSLPRNGIDVKKSYLASIESLDDDEFSEDGGPQPETRHLRERQLVARDRDSVGSLSEGFQNYGVSSSHPAPCKPRWCDPNLSHTDRVILEIVTTEGTYVRDLNEIIQGYMKCISSSNDMKISHQSLEELFSNIEDIYKFNSLFLEELEQCQLDPVAVARCFVKNSNGFAIYTDYCTNYPRTVSVLTDLMRNSETAEIFKERQTALQHSLPLGSYLLKPVQRVLKYHLLLQNLVKHSDKENEGYADIKNALSVMTGIAYHINEMKRKHEHAVRVQEIQSLLYGWEGQDLTTYGELVAEGAFRMFRAKALRHLFLFDKMLLIAKKKEEGILSYKTHIMCSNLMLIESIQGEPLCFHVIPFDNPRYQYTFQTRNLEQKREWCLQLKRVILENYNAVIPSHARQLVMELGQNRQDDAVPLEKSTTRRQLSAPEYLEKRKQERRKSEISLNRAFKLKKGTKKNELNVTPKDSPAIDRRSRSSSAGKCSTLAHLDDPADGTSISNMERSHSRASTVGSYSSPQSPQHETDMEQEHSQEVGCLSSSKESLSQQPTVCTEDNTRKFSKGKGGEKQRLGTPGSLHNHRMTAKERHSRLPWRAWNSLPEETTDTENEDCSERVDLRKLLDYRPPPRTFRTKARKETNDSSGEYVTFFFAHSHACRDTEATSESFSMLSGSQRSSMKEEDIPTPVSSPERSFTCRNLNKNSTNVDKHKTKHSSQNKAGSSETKEKLDSESISGSNTSSSWKQNAAVRRVQSFTGIAKAKVASLHHSFSFRQKPAPFTESRSNCKRPSVLPLSSCPSVPLLTEDISPTAPAAWLKQQEQHLANGTNKSGSLPRSFQLGQDFPICKSSDTSPDISGGSVQSEPSNHRFHLRQHSEPRPITIASDKPTQADFVDNLERYIEDSPSKRYSYHFPLQREFSEQDTTTGCTNTPAVSMENVHAIHPEHKIYHQAASKYATIKNVFSNVGSKLAGLKATLSVPSSAGHTDSCSNISTDSEHLKVEQMLGRSASRSSIKSDREVNPKVLTAKLMHSVAKAYSSMIKQRLKKHENMKRSESSLSFIETKITMPIHKPGSSVIGARMAQPLESEYSVPKNCIPSRQTRSIKEGDLRPDSLFSESSNATSSSDGDKAGGNDFPFSPIHLLPKDDEDHEESQSDASESSADSYYERTFEAIENALTEDMFRDSAIYSDPEDADFSAVEYSPLKESENESKLYWKDIHGTENNRCKNKDPQLELVCVRRVDRAIVERLRILEENVKFQKEDFSEHSEGKKNVKHQKSEKWSPQGHSPECDESESSSEHSASTVNTVMESANSRHVGSPTNQGPCKSQPRIKGWVKHVVDKLQGESQA